MNDKNLTPNNNDFLHELDVLRIFRVLTKNKSFIILTTLIFSIIGVSISLFIPNKYTSRAVIASAEADSSALQLGQYASVANLAGIQLPIAEVDKLSAGIEVISSFDFFTKLVNKNNLFFKVFASNGWNSSKNSLKINKNIYDIELNKWVSDEKFSVDGKPSMQASHKIFMDNLGITKDKLTGFVNLSYTHYSPYVAKEVLEGIIYEINENTRDYDIQIAKNTLNFLEEEALKTKTTEVKSSISLLIQSQIEKITIAKATPQYLFKVLSPPIAPELKSRPSRIIIVFLFFIIGFIFSSFYKIYKDFKYQQ